MVNNTRVEQREIPVSVFAVLFVYGTTHRMHVSMCWAVIKLQSEVWCGTQRFPTSSFQVIPLNVLIIFQLCLFDCFVINMRLSVWCVSTYWLYNLQRMFVSVYISIFLAFQWHYSCHQFWMHEYRVSQRVRPLCLSGSWWVWGLCLVPTVETSLEHV